MDECYASKYHELEENHWWFIGRRNIIFDLIKDYPKNIDILEVGCSGGPLLRFLDKHGFRKLHGIDIDEEAIGICRQKGIIDIRVADAEKTGFKDQQFDIVIASDVLEHIKDEDKALLEWHRILKPFGKLLIFVPAFKFLWSRHDEVNHHFRRYSRSMLTQILEKTNFKIERISYWNFCLFFPTSFIRILQRILLSNVKKPGGQLFEANAFSNKTLEFILKFENKILSTGMNFPFGVSLFAIARKI